MKKSMKILAGMAAFLLIIIILWLANGVLGNPISKIMANSISKKYIEKTYPNMILNIDDAYYSFKSGDYYVQINSPTSKDTYFTLTISPFGKVINDSYEDNVENKYNTFHRINSVYSSKVDSVFKSRDLPYKSDIYFGEIRDINNSPISEDDEYTYPVYGLDTNKLQLDKDYDINSIGKKAGHIVFYAQDEDVSIKKASEILLDIKDILDNENISFYAINFTLEKPRNNDEAVSSDYTSIAVEEFIYEDIYEENLERRLSEAHESLQKYYKKLDIKKLEQER